MSPRWNRGTFTITLVYSGVTVEIEATAWRGSPWDTGPDGVVTFDIDEPDGNCTFWNRDGLLAVQVISKIDEPHEVVAS